MPREEPTDRGADDAREAGHPTDDDDERSEQPHHGPPRRHLRCDAAPGRSTPSRRDCHEHDEEQGREPARDERGGVGALRVNSRRTVPVSPAGTTQAWAQPSTVTGRSLDSPSVASQPALAFSRTTSS